MGTGIFLVALGAFLTWAVVDHVRNLNLDVAGWIIMLAGVAVMVNAKIGDKTEKTVTLHEESGDPDAPSHDVEETVEERHTD
jgi:branched-subunit amino acid ABC-type transport system permease component